MTPLSGTLWLDPPLLFKRTTFPSKDLEVYELTNKRDYMLRDMDATVGKRKIYDSVD
jgi:hypothetical protein